MGPPEEGSPILTNKVDDRPKDINWTSNAIQVRGYNDSRVTILDTDF